MVRRSVRIAASNCVGFPRRAEMKLACRSTAPPRAKPPLASATGSAGYTSQHERNAGSRAETANPGTAPPASGWIAVPARPQ